MMADTTISRFKKASDKRKHDNGQVEGALLGGEQSYMKKKPEELQLTKKKEVSLMVYLSEELKEELKVYAAKQHKSIKDVVREAVTEYIRK